MNSFMPTVILALIGFVLFGLVASAKCKGVWRYIFLLPIVFIIGVTSWVFIDINNNPASHNLLPFELLMYLVYAIVAQIVLITIKAVVNKRASSNETT